jgi:4,5-DOPA dioxygenase extradiol
MIGRRELMRLLAAGAAATATGGLAGAASPAARPGSVGGAQRAQRGGRMPVVFVAHGAPPLLDIPTWVGELHRWAEAMPRPSAVLVLSAHWEERPATVGATRPVPLIRDFYGFPEKYYRQEYPAPGAPALAGRVRQLLSPLGPVASHPGRGLDHGAYVPLVAMYPAADVPVLQLSLPGLEPATLLAMGRSLAPLRDEGVLIEGSGFITHNLRAVDPRLLAPTPAWAEEFDAWTAEALGRRDVDALADFMGRGPGARLALPTTEHFAPLLAALGAAGDVAPRFPITGFWMGSLTRRSVQWG